MAVIIWRSYVSYQVSESKLYYLNSLPVCKLVRYEVMRNLESLLNKPAEHRKSYYYAVYLYFTKCEIESCNSQCTRMAELEESGGPQPVCPIKGRID